MQDYSPFHVGMNALLLSSQESSYRSAGIHYYISGLLPALMQLDKSFRYSVFTSDSKPALPENARVLRTGKNKVRPLQRILWEQFAQPRLLGKLKLDLLHSLAFVSPLLSHIPSIVTVYDLSFLHFPERFKTANRNYLRLFTRLSCQRARRVVAISENTRRDIVEQYQIPAERVDVVYPGLDERFKPLSPEAIAEFRARKGLPERYIFYLGTIEPRKNLNTLIRAYARLLPGNVKLVCAGGRGWMAEDVFQTVQELRLQRNVLFPGYVSREELPLWYNAAEVFVYPSSYEGFGLPVLEAMACGVPSITTHSSSLPEVAGDAAYLLPPEDPTALADALSRLLESPAERTRLQARGPQQAEKFRWENSAREMLASYQRALNPVARSVAD